MHRAGQLLREGAESVATIAERVGYQSEATFAKAFKRTVGLTRMPTVAPDTPTSFPLQTGYD